ncbi:MAG: hypothetical protein JNL58_22305 [Planctomyces sp.]|nr:hypothetical protein [Planctomyces sp.]
MIPICLLLLLVGDSGGGGAALPVENDCGVNCLYVAMNVLTPDQTVRLKQLQLRLKPEDKGNTLGELSEVAIENGLQAMPLVTSLEALEIRKRPFVFIAHLNRGHFVLFADIAADTVTIVDPPGKAIVPRSSLPLEWSGAGLIVSSSEIENEDSVRRRLWWIRHRWNICLGVAGVLALALGTKIAYSRWRLT